MKRDRQDYERELSGAFVYLLVYLVGAAMVGAGIMALAFWPF